VLVPLLLWLLSGLGAAGCAVAKSNVESKRRWCGALVHGVCRSKTKLKSGVQRMSSVTISRTGQHHATCSGAPYNRQL
jgi:hypothetical protein